MANLGATFDATGIEPIQPLEVLPPGKYIAQIVNSDMRLTKDGTGQYLFLEIDVLEGPYQGRKLFDRLNLVNARRPRRSRSPSAPCRRSATPPDACRWRTARSCTSFPSSRS